jgi:hypothetical protein
MALVNAGLAIVTVGYILGVWTACAVFHERQTRDDHRASTRRSIFSIQPEPEVMWISEPRR